LTLIHEDGHESRLRREMRIYDVKQGTEEWIDARLGIVTASELDALISPTWKIRTGEGPRTYLFRKLAEAWLCKPVVSFGSYVTEQGNILEPEARPWFELANSCDVSTKAGFILADDNRCGCSPDGIIEAKGEGLEIKCPQETNAVRYAIDGVLPTDYELQVHGSLYVTGFARWHFLSYHRRLPKLHIVVERDEAKCAIIAEALAGFYAKFDAEWDKLNRLADEPRENPFK
jgi:hypothetical protein